MIIRVFRASVPTAKHQAFEQKFRSLSLPLVQSQTGLIAVRIGRPSATNPEEFVMISEWRSQDDLRQFTGEDWTQPHIPPGMEDFIVSCSLDHYESIDE